MNDLLYQGHPVYIATKCFQRKKHHKKRINKKWQKRYGFYEFNMMPHNQVIMMDNGVIWMTKRTFDAIKEAADLLYAKAADDLDRIACTCLHFTRNP